MRALFLLSLLSMSAYADRIVFFGDSLTEMGDLEDGWVKTLRERVKTEVINSGISGDKVSDLLERVNRDVPSLSHVVVFIGTNDVWGFLGFSGTARDTFEDELRDLVKTLIDKGNKVSLCTLGVIGERKKNRLDSKLDDYSGIIRTVASDFDLQVCDIRKAFTEYLKNNNPKDKEEGILTSDGVHLSAEGNRIVAEEIQKLLSSSQLK